MGLAHKEDARHCAAKKKFLPAFINEIFIIPTTLPHINDNGLGQQKQFGIPLC